MIISIDVGYGYTKAINEQGQKQSFPSLVAPGYNREIEGIFGAEQGGLDNLHLDVDGEEVFVGELARRSGNASYTLEVEKVNHRNTKVLLAAAAALVMPYNQEKVHIATGLPFQEYTYQKANLEKLLKDMQIRVRFLSGQLKGQEKNIAVSTVTIFPQGAGVVYSSMDFQQLKEIARSGKLLSVVDIGYKTTDVVTFEAGKKFSLLSSLSGTIDAGAADFERQVQNLFMERTGHRLDPTRVARVIEYGGIDFRGQFLDMRDAIERAREALAQLIIDKVKLLWKDQTDFIWRVFLAGGGALLLQRYVSNIHFSTKTVADAQFANAKGFLEVAKRRS